MKLGILGTGMIVHMALPSLDALDIEKKAIFSTPRSVEKAQKIADEHGIEKVYTDYDELLAGDVDTIYVGLPNALHYEFAKKALEAGKDVIMEKPMTSNPSQLKELMDLAKEKDRILVEAVTHLYMPAFLQLKENLKKIGRIRLFCFNYSQYSSRYDKFKEGIIAPAFDPKQSGGAFMDLNVYNVNAAFALFGVPENMVYYPNIDRNIDTSGICNFTYPDFQGVCLGAKDCFAPNISTIQGDKGTIVIDEPVSSMTHFEIRYVGGNTERVEIEHPKERMDYEFITFNDWISTHNKEEADKMLELSYEICKGMAQARKAAGILYPSDEESAD